MNVNLFGKFFMERILPIIAKIIDKSAAIVTLISAGIVGYLLLVWESLMREFTINLLTIAIVIVLLLILIPLEIIMRHRCTKELYKIKEQYNNKGREYNKMKEEYDSVKSQLSKAKEQYNNKDREYNEMKEEYDSFKSQLCYFINQCNIFQNGDNTLACYLEQENAYFTDNTLEINNAIENCKACAEHFKQSHTQRITRLESEINDYSRRLNNQDFKVFIDRSGEDKKFGDAIQEYLEEQQIHCDLIGNNLPNLSELLDKNTIIITLDYNAPKSWLSARFRAYSQSTTKAARKTNRNQIHFFTCSKNEKPSEIRLPKDIKWQYYGADFSPEDCLNKIELINRV